jgi:hypothetical protein
MSLIAVWVELLSQNKSKQKPTNENRSRVRNFEKDVKTS